MIQSGMTIIGCPAAHQAQDDWFAQFLASTPAITFDGDLLRLESGSTVIDLIDKATLVPNPLIGSEWILESIENGGADIPLPAGLEATMNFSDQGLSDWYMGCAGGASYYERTGPEQASLWFIPVETYPSPRSCGNKAFVEDALRSTLSATDVPFRIDHATLTLSGPEHTLVFKRR
jgi:hypothetical protein